MTPSNPTATRKRFRTVVERAIARAEREAAEALARLVPNTPRHGVVRPAWLVRRPITVSSEEKIRA